jgi:small GTP-binding protein
MKNDIITLKYILAGDSSVGKSSILQYYVNNSFNEMQTTTIGVDFGIKRVVFNDNNYKIRIWDTAGQEKFKSIVQTYFRDVIGAILVFDITDRNSFDNIISWIQTIRANSKNQIAFMLVANKSDLDSYRTISTLDAELFAKNNNMLYFETSAKKTTNIDAMFKTLTTHIQTTIIDNDTYKSHNGYYINNINSDKDFVNLNNKIYMKSCCKLN